MTSDLDRFERETEYIIADLSEGGWGERLVALVVGRYWRYRIPRLRAISESAQSQVLTRLGWQGGFLP